MLLQVLLKVSELLIIIAMVCLGDTYHMEISQLFCDAVRMEWDLLNKLQPSKLSYNLHPPRSPFLVTLQFLIKVFANDNPHSIFFE